MAVDAPEEVVGSEESEVAAEVAVALDGVVLGLGDVLVVAGEEDQSFASRSPETRSMSSCAMGMRTDP